MNKTKMNHILTPFAINKTTKINLVNRLYKKKIKNWSTLWNTRRNKRFSFSHSRTEKRVIFCPIYYRRNNSIKKLSTTH